MKTWKSVGVARTRKEREGNAMIRKSALLLGMMVFAGCANLQPALTHAEKIEERLHAALPDFKPVAVTTAPAGESVEPPVKVAGLTIDAEIADLRISKDKMSWRLVSGTKDDSKWPTKVIKKKCRGQTHLYVFRDGRWQGGKYDFFTSGQQAKDLKNVYGNYTGIIPKAGEEVAFCLTDVFQSKYRSNVLRGVWP